MFIGREKELVLLQQDYIGKAVMVYGKRRVWKDHAHSESP
mgnify:CR=1 FL=1